MESRTIAVRYCGGCNPLFNRTALAAKLREDLPWLELAGSVEVCSWFALVICGCSRKCASHGDLQGRKGKLVLSSAEEYEALRETLARLLKEES